MFINLKFNWLLKRLLQERIKCEVKIKILVFIICTCSKAKRYLIKMQKISFQNILKVKRIEYEKKRFRFSINFYSSSFNLRKYNFSLKTAHALRKIKCNLLHYPSLEYVRIQEQEIPSRKSESIKRKLDLISSPKIESLFFHVVLATVEI